MTRADEGAVHVPLLPRTEPTPRDVQVAAMAVLIRHKATDLAGMLFAPVRPGRSCHVCGVRLHPTTHGSRCIRHWQRP